jgi:predicted aminopeptidase
MTDHPATGDPGSQAEILAAISAAREDLASSLADLRATVEELRARPLLSDEERQALEEQAESGELGEDMQTLVARIRSGEDSWEAVFSGESPHASLLQAHLARVVDEHQDDIALAFEELVEAEEAKGNFFLDDVPPADEGTTRR